jgi:hypothetical protein
MQRNDAAKTCTHSNQKEVIATMSYTARAEHLADTEDLATELAEAAGRCQKTGLDPDVYRGLIVATVMLGQRPKRGLAWANDVELVTAVEDLTDAARTQATAVNQLGVQVQQALDQAEAELAAAQAALRAAETDHDEAAARARIAKARQMIADCMEALEILTDAAQRLAFVLAKLLAVPDELGDTYEAAYETVSRGHRLPHDGRFLGASA